MAQTEIQTLKEEKTALNQALETKAKEVRAQLLQVLTFKIEYAACSSVLFDFAEVVDAKIMALALV